MLVVAAVSLMLCLLLFSSVVSLFVSRYRSKLSVIFFGLFFFSFLWSMHISLLIQTKQLFKAIFEDSYFTWKMDFNSKDINWWTGVMWFSSGLYWYFYQLFGLSFWRHPFTAEDPLVSKWYNAIFFQICSDEETNSSTFWMAWGWVHFQLIFMFGWTIPLTWCQQHKVIGLISRECNDCYAMQVGFE